MCAGFLVDECDQRVFATGTVVLFGGGGTSREELDGWIGGYVLRLGRGFAVVGFGINFGDDDCGFGREG